MDVSEVPDQAIARYSMLAEAYIERYGTVEQAEAEDRAVLASWADQVHGPVLDAGCGPGHWTQFIAGAHRVAVGVDLVPLLLDHARSRYPAAEFLYADLARLPFEDQSFAGVLSWYSIIHAQPEQLPRILAEFSRVLKDHGSLLLGFFSGTRLEPFEHQVSTAWYWPAHQLSELLQAAGFEVQEQVTRERQGARRHGHLVAKKRA